MQNMKNSQVNNSGIGNSEKTSEKKSEIKKGDVYYADLSPVVGSEQGGVRPVLIVQNDVGNKFSPTVIAAAITSQNTKANIPTHVEIKSNESGLAMDSMVLLEQIRTIDKTRIVGEKVGTISNLEPVNNALTISFGINNFGSFT